MKKAKILILGAGSGGISVASRLKKTLGAGHVAIIEPSDKHYYQPLWTLVGAGVVKKEKTEKALRSLIPAGVELIKDSVSEIQAGTNTVTCSSGLQVQYDFLVIATGLKLDFHKIKGLDGQLGRNGICSIYQYEQAEKTAEMLEAFQGGDAIFTMPPVPIKCAGAPQKIMYLADEIFRRNNVRSKSKIGFTTAGKVIFGVPSFAQALMKVAAKKGIDLHFSHRLVEVNADTKTAIFEKQIEATVDGQTQVSTERIEMKYDLLHVVPPMSPHDFIMKSGLAYDSGPQANWLKVDKSTLQHLDHPLIFGIGDVTGVPNSKTGAAIRKQAPVVVQNLLDVMNSRSPSLAYDGYSSCPLITGFGKVILAEFGYDNKLLPSFPLNMTKERKSMWILKKDLLPKMYWHGMMKGRM